MGRKIDYTIENPIDNIFIYICEKISPIFYELNMTPNQITTLSLIFGILSMYCLYNDRLESAFIFYLIQYLFDCLDGYYARKYNMQSKFGDYYDHFKDWFVAIGIFIILLYKIKNKKLFFITNVILVLLLNYHMGCQEMNSKYNQFNDVLEMTNCCMDKEHIHITKYFGAGTINLFTAIMILLSNRI